MSQSIMQVREDVQSSFDKLLVWAESGRSRTFFEFAG